MCDGSFSRSKFITLVDVALCLHKGHLCKFTISGKKTYHHVFDRWMLMLSMRSLSSITIKLTSGPKYKIPSSLFSINCLKHVHLKNCIISLPSVFQGLKRLTVLNLNTFSSTDSDIYNLILCCPDLTNLKLVCFESINCLDIRAPELKYLEVLGYFKDICLDAPNLEWASVTLKEAEDINFDPVKYGRKSSLKQALGSLSNIKNLAISMKFLTHLSRGCLLTKLSAFDRLEIIFLDLCCSDQREILTACSIFQNAPILKELELSLAPCNETSGPMSMWEQVQALQELTLQMDHLVTVSVTNFEGMACEVAFLGKLLSWAPVLEKVKITVDRESVKDDPVVLRKLLALPRASHKVGIIFT